jgi:hypothetical protein
MNHCKVIGHLSQNLNCLAGAFCRCTHQAWSGERRSYQKYFRREEHWKVVQGKP